MNQAIAKIESSAIAVQSLSDMQQIGKLFNASQMFVDVKSEAQAVVKIMAGAELGLSPFASMAELHIVKGKVSLSAGLLAKKVKASGRYDYRVVETSDKVCSIDFFQNGERIGNSTFTIEQARKAQVQNLDKWPQNMLFARAISNGVRFYCPDVTGQVAVYTDGEIEDHPPANVQPLRAVSPPVVTVEADGETTVIPAPYSLDDSYIQQIEALAIETGTNLAPVLKRANVSTICELSQDQADKTIDWLKKKAAAFEAERQTEAVHGGANSDAVPVVRKAQDATESNDAASGLDQWLCTQESGSRALAMNLLSVWSEAMEKLGLDDQQMRDEMNEVFPNRAESITSRKQLTQQEAAELIVHFRAYIDAAAKREK